MARPDVRGEPNPQLPSADRHPCRWHRCRGPQPLLHGPRLRGLSCAGLQCSQSAVSCTAPRSGAHWPLKSKSSLLITGVDHKSLPKILRSHCRVLRRQPSFRAFTTLGALGSSKHFRRWGFRFTRKMHHTRHMSGALCGHLPSRVSSKQHLYRCKELLNIPSRAAKPHLPGAGSDHAFAQDYLASSEKVNKALQSRKSSGVRVKGGFEGLRYCIVLQRLAV